MNEFIICLIKYTSIFMCMLYAYTRLLRIKLKAWDLFDIPLFTALSAVLYFVTVYIKVLVPIGLLIFGLIFLFLRFRKTFYETVTIGTISSGLSIVMYILSFLISIPINMLFNFVNNANLKIFGAQLVVSMVLIVGTFLLFKVKRLQSGVNPKGETATFEILLFFSVGSIFTLMIVYTKNATQSVYETVLLVITLFGLLLFLWWRRHITYNYREAVKQRYVNRMEDTIEEYKLNSAENDLQVAVYAKLFHYLNKAMPHCALLAESAATKTGDADISANVESWFTVRKLHKDDIHILLSYLCDNAVISALGLPDAKVRLELGATKRFEPLIRIYDSGEQFDEKVLSRLGLEQITTRAYIGGSGIGLFTAFEILAKYGASFTLDEAPKISGFSKVIEIAFDGCNSITVRTMRESAIDACVARRGIIVERIESEEEETLRDGTNG